MFDNIKELTLLMEQQQANYSICKKRKELSDSVPFLSPNPIPCNTHFPFILTTTSGCDNISGLLQNTENGI